MAALWLWVRLLPWFTPLYRFPYLSTTPPETQALCPVWDPFRRLVAYQRHRLSPLRGSHRAARRRKSHHPAPALCLGRSCLSFTSGSCSYLLLVIFAFPADGLPAAVFVSERVLFTFQGAVSWSTHIVQDVLYFVVTQFVLISSTNCANFMVQCFTFIFTPSPNAILQTISILIFSSWLMTRSSSSLTELHSFPTTR